MSLRGQILVINAQQEAGAIVMADGQRFLFHLREWQDLLPPERGMAVEFTLGEDQRGRQVRLAPPEPIHAGAAPAPIPLAQKPKRKAVLTLATLFLGVFGAHRFYMGAWGWGLAQVLGLLLLGGILGALLPALGTLLFLAAFVLTYVELIRYIWMSDAAFDAKVKAYQAQRPGPFAFFW